MSRVPEVTRAQLLPDDQSIYDEIAGSRGSVRGPFAMLLHSPQVAQRAAHLGSYIRFETTLEKSVLELVTLIVAREWDCQYEWTAHEPLARQSGVRSEAVVAVRDRKTPEGLTEDEAVVVRYVEELLRSHRVTEETFQAAQERFGLQGITDLTATIGYYSMLACVLDTFEASPPSGVTPLLPV